ncbi:MAG: HD domain-containing phosphohydrolase [Candidatus Omnitrophota bacterium]
MLIILSVFLGVFIGYKIAEIIYKKKLFYFYNNPKARENVLVKESIQENIPVKESILEDKIWYESALGSVFEFSEELSLNLERQKFIKLLTEGACSLLNVERSVLLLWDKESEGLIVAGAVGLTKDFSQYPVLKNENCISRFVMSQRQILIINDLEQDGYFKKINIEEYLQKSFISVPLVFQGNVLGILHACDKKYPNQFTRKDELLITNISRTCAIALQNVNLYEQIQQDYLKTIAVLSSALDARDSYTMRHSDNVAKYAVAIAQNMQLRQDEVDLLKQAGLLHDIGKIGIKDDILLKPGKLTPDEFEYIKLHPIKGEEIVSVLPFLKKAARLIRHHHERYDGSGYPDRIKGQDIDIGARILAVADVFDALTTDRPYRKAFSFGEALDELERNKGTKFDSEIVDCLHKIIQDKTLKV